MFPLGDVPAGSTLYLPFDTYNASGASVTITGLAVTDIEIYKNGSTTQRASDNGYALLDTDGIDFDGSTGLHGFSIDLADNSDSGFYAAGAQYWVHVNAITVDSQTVKFTYYFRIVAAESVAGTPKADVSHFGGTAGTFSGGRPEVNTTHFGGSALTQSGGRPEVNVSHFGGSAGTFASGRPEVKLGDVAHGGTAGTLTLERIIVASTTTNEPAVKLTGNGTGAGTLTTGGASGPGLHCVGGGTVGSGLHVSATNGNAMTVASLSGHGLSCSAGGSNKHGLLATGGTAGTSDGIKATAGTGGVDIRGNLTGDITGNLSGSVGSLATQAKADVNAEVDAALADVNLDHLVGTAAGIPAVPAGTFLDQIMDDGTATFDRTTDSLQAIRDRGDAAWTTGGGGSITDLLNVVPMIPTSIDLANTASWRLGLLLTNALDDLPSTAEIDPGTISIDRKAIGATSWTAVVSDVACSESAGLVYFDEVFDAGTGYVEGDSIRVTFKSQKITVSANDYEISDSTGRIFYTEIRQTERGTNSAALASEWTAARAAKLDEITAARLSELDDSAGKLVHDIATILLTDRLTGARAALLDKLNITGNVAGSQEVLAIQNNTRVVRSVPVVIERPDSGTTTYRIELLLYDDVGNMEAPDSAPTIELVNQAGTDRSSRLDSTTMALVETGRYRAIYTASVGDALEQLKWTFSVVEGGATRKYGNDSLIVDTTAVDFTAADRTKLDTLHDARLTAARAGFLDNLNGHVPQSGDSFAIVNSGTHGNAALKTLLDAIAAFVDTEIAAIKAKTDNLPASPANEATLLAVQKFVEADLYVDTTVTPWDLVWIERGTGAPGTGTQLLRKNLGDVAGGNITNTTTVIGRAYQ